MIIQQYVNHVYSVLLLIMVNIPTSSPNSWRSPSFLVKSTMARMVKFPNKKHHEKPEESHNESPWNTDLTDWLQLNYIDWLMILVKHYPHYQWLISSLLINIQYYHQLVSLTTIHSPENSCHHTANLRMIPPIHWPSLSGLTTRSSHIIPLKQNAKHSSNPMLSFFQIWIIYGIGLSHNTIIYSKIWIQCYHFSKYFLYFGYISSTSPYPKIPHGTAPPRRSGPEPSQRPWWKHVVYIYIYVYDCICIYYISI